MTGPLIGTKEWTNAMYDELAVFANRKNRTDYSSAMQVWICAFCGHATTFGGSPQYCRGGKVGKRQPHAPYRMARCLALRHPLDDLSEQVDPRERVSLGLADMTTKKD